MDHDLRNRMLLRFLALVAVGLAAAVLPERGEAASDTQTLYSFCPGTACTDGQWPFAGVIIDTNGNLYGTTVAGGLYGFGTVFKLASSGTETVLHSFVGGSDGESPDASLIMDSSGNFYGTTFYGGQYGYGTVFKLTSGGTETVLHSFTGGSDGAHPYAGVIMDSGGNLYGTTVAGGNSACSNNSPSSGVASGCGTVFKLTSGRTETVLHGFTGGSDGANPYAGLIFNNGSLYGTASAGGNTTAGCVNNITLNTPGCGTVFTLKTDGTSFAPVYTFSGGADAANPGAALIVDTSGNLYGTAVNGGASNAGAVFRVTTAGVETVLYSFTGGSDGANPIASLIMDTRGNLYGTTYNGGTSPIGFGSGTVFQLSPNSSAPWTETVLYDFCSQSSAQTACTDGINPSANLIADNSGTLYTTTPYDGAYGGGSVFGVQLIVFAGTPGKPNCHGKSVSALTQQYGGLNAAAAALGYASVAALQNAITASCGG